MTTYRNMIKVGGYNTNTELVKQVQQVQLHMVKSGDFFYFYLNLAGSAFPSSL